MTRTQIKTGTWSIAAPFFKDANSSRWIDDFVQDKSRNFRKVSLSAPDDWHARSHRETGINMWLKYWDQGRRAFPAAGIITVFPQLALTAAIQKSLRRLDTPLLAWCFNLGEHPRGLKKLAIRKAFKVVDRFVVHSRGEIPIISELLQVSPNKVLFVPLQRAPIPIQSSEDLTSPFIVAMGSANRDYKTFFKAAEICGLPCKVIASPRAVEGLEIPANVSIASGLSPEACHRIVQQSRISVVPIACPDVASGQVTVIESMRMNTPVIATESIGTIDYVRSGQNGLLVQPHDPERLADAMQELWDDAALRQRFASNASLFADQNLSDQAAAHELIRIILELEGERQPTR